MDLKRKYILNLPDELMEYAWLRPSITGLKVDIFVDDSESYRRNGHVPFVLVRNGYGRTVSEFLQISISDNPEILNPELDYGISYNDIFDIQDFIAENRGALKLLCNESINLSEFRKYMVVRHAYLIAESFIVEMATLHASESTLPMDIWLDEGATFIRHAPRLKFRASREQRTTREFSSMTLTENPQIENFPETSPIKKKDLEKLKRFVVENLDLLLELANGNIDYQTEFLPFLKIE